MRNNKKRSTNKNNIIILCEGTDTEFNYFTELKEYVEQLATKHKELFGKFYQILTSQ